MKTGNEQTTETGGETTARMETKLVRPTWLPKTPKKKTPRKPQKKKYYVEVGVEATIQCEVVASSKKEAARLALESPYDYEIWYQMGESIEVEKVELMSHNSVGGVGK